MFGLCWICYIFDLLPGKVSSSCPPVVWRQEQLCARLKPILAPTSSNKQGLFETQKREKLRIFSPALHRQATSKARKKRIGHLEDIFTCSPPVTKLVQLCRDLGVARSGREPRYLPSESYLGHKEEDMSTFPLSAMIIYLSTFPWAFHELPPITTKPLWKATAQVLSPPFSRVSCVPPKITIGILNVS